MTIKAAKDNGAYYLVKGKYQVELIKGGAAVVTDFQPSICASV